MGGMAEIELLSSILTELRKQTALLESIREGTTATGNNTKTLCSYFDPQGPNRHLARNK